MKESFLYYTIKCFGWAVRRLPLRVSLWCGRMIGRVAYYFDARHRGQAYANLKMAFAESKSPDEIRKITKGLFKNYGQNLIELLRLPLLNRETMRDVLKIEGREHVRKALEKKKGTIFLAMHFGSWEIASLSAGMIDFPYKVIVKPQSKYSRLDELLNEYRSCGGSVVLSRGMGTRDLVKSLNNNEVIGMVVDQGGKDGCLVPFFGREASMSVGAIRLALKRDVPVCFSIIIREGGGRHRMVIHEPLDIVRTGDDEKDIYENLKKVTQLMESYIRKYPSEYMWFYKIWKYSKQSNIMVLQDDKVGHSRQSQTVAKLTRELLEERKIKPTIQSVDVRYKNKFVARLFSVLSVVLHPVFFQGRLGLLKWVLTEQSYNSVMSMKADFIISCGSALAPVNYLLSKDHKAKSLVVLKPGLLSMKKFDLVVLPRHDFKTKDGPPPKVALTHAAPNLIDEKYLQKQSEQLLERFHHLKKRSKLKIGLFIGGDSKNVFLSEEQVRVLLWQVLEVAKNINADVLATSSRRTPRKIEQMMYRMLKKHPLCPLLILANQQNVPEAVGGILGLSDIAVVSGDSISMVSEAASSGKFTVVFTPNKRDVLVRSTNKHLDFIENLNKQGFVLSCHVKDIGESIFSIAKNKIQTRKIDDNQIIKEALRYVI